MGRYSTQSEKARPLHRTYSPEAAGILEGTPRGRQSARISASVLDSDVSRTEFKRVMGFSYRPDPDAAMQDGGKTDPEGDRIYDECYDAWVDVRASAAGHADHLGAGKCCLDHNEKVRRYGEVHGRAVKYSARQIRDGINDRLARRPRAARPAMMYGTPQAILLAVLVLGAAAYASVYLPAGWLLNPEAAMPQGILVTWGISFATLLGSAWYVWWLIRGPAGGTRHVNRLRTGHHPSPSSSVAAEYARVTPPPHH